MSTILTAAERALLADWARRCRRGQFSLGVVGLCELRVYRGSCGETPHLYPQLAAAGLRAELAPDERFALDYAERLVAEHRQAGHKVFAVSPANGNGFPLGEELAQLDATRALCVLILAPETRMWWDSLWGRGFGSVDERLP